MVLPALRGQSGAPLASRNYARSRIWALYGLMGCLLVGYLGYLVFRSHDRYSAVIDGFGVAAFELVVSALCLMRGLNRRNGRSMAVALGLGLFCWSLGDLALAVESLGGATPGTPSLADAFYLSYYPFAYIAVMLFVRGEVRRVSTPNWLDSAVAGLGTAAVCAAFAFSSIVRLVGGGPLSVATNLAYPVGDMLLLILVAGSATMLAGRRKAPWWMLAGGIALNVAGDTINLFSSSVGASHAGVVTNAISWPAAILLMSMAVWVPSGHPDPGALQKPSGFLLPGMAAVAGLVVLVTGTLEHLNLVAIGLATAALTVVGLRLALSVGGLRNLTAERHRESVTDDLTGLRNRRHLFQILNAFFADETDAHIEDRRLAFMFLDLCRFKEINDSFGHPAGDEVLRQLGARLSGSLRESDLLVRLGGDEFAIVLMGADSDYAKVIAERLIGSLERPFVVNGVNMTLGVNIGIALAPADATDADRLVWCADVAMYRAKEGKVPIALYDEGLDHGGDRLRLAEELRHAIQDGELVLHYQPQLDLRTGEIFSVEVLVRWSHRRLGLIPPLKFLSLAEDADLMGPLTTSVLTQALEQCAAWRGAGRAMTVSVNISVTNLLETGFTALVQSLLARSGLPAEALVLEITETSVITEFDRCRGVIDELQAMQVVVSIDDFGTGFTSMAHLTSLSVGELKLDRAFIAGLGAGEPGRELQLVRATINLGHALGLRVVAEGIADAATLALISDLGCDLAQGYGIGRPKPADELAFRLPDPQMPSAPAHSEPPVQAPARDMEVRAKALK